MTRRRYREPSQRNKDIWKAVRIERRGQEEVARELGVSQPRVSQIVRRMAAWYAEHTPEMLAASELAARGRLAEIEYRQQVELCLRESVAAVKQSQQPLVTKKTRKSKTIENDVVVCEVIVEETVERQQPVSTRAITLVGKNAERLWELAAGSAGPAEPGRRSTSSATAGSSREEEFTGRLPEEDADDPIKSYERRCEEGRASAASRLELVRPDGLTLEEAEYWSYGDAISTGWVYPSYYEKNVDGITFKVADWVRDHVPPESLHGPERQPVWTCHDIPDWDAWCGSDEALQAPVRAACLARWEAWRARVGAPPRRGNPNHVNCEFWRWHEKLGIGNRAGGNWEGEAPAEPPHGAERAGEAGSAGRAEFDRTATSSATPGFSRPEEPKPPTAIERLLASGRSLPRRERDRLTGLAARRRAAAEGHVSLPAAAPTCSRTECSVPSTT